MLLGQAVERLSGLPLHQAVRERLGLDRLGLNDTWWELLEQPPAGTPERAVQTLDGIDTNVLSGTIDLYGGGGIIASTADMALFFDALFLIFPLNLTLP